MTGRDRPGMARAVAGYTDVMTIDIKRMSALAAVAALVVASGCNGDDEVTDEVVTAELAVVVAHPDHPTLEYRISCDGEDASISGDDVGLDASAACEALEDQEVVDRLVVGIPTDRVCAQVFDGHDVATISGTVNEVPVGTMVDRTDACMIEDWDDLLDDLLPPPRPDSPETP